MRSLCRNLVLATAITVVPVMNLAPTFAQTTKPANVDVPVKQVVLFSSGVGYFEHFGNIQGDGSTELRFKTNQINDILKSLILQDLDGGRVNIAACSVGGAAFALDTAKTYMESRKQFGQALKDFQALQFKIADMATEIDAGRLMVYRAAAAIDTRDPDATKYCAMAKRLVTDTAFKVANDALQLLGGYGYLADYGIEKIVRDLRVHQILEGTNEIMRVITARALLAERP